jgi:EAL domain-containing protein (putative c-di-GMP-specific phosphodiesterase class I)
MMGKDDNMEIFRTIVGLSQNKGMDLVAEGVESYEQILVLRKLGCEYGQGYFFSKPIDPADAATFIGEHSRSTLKIPVRVPQKKLLVA